MQSMNSRTVFEAFILDFRLCEALASGAMILVDHMYVPRPNPFLDHQHLVYYGSSPLAPVTATNSFTDNNNKTDLFEKLDYYVRDEMAAREIAWRGYLHAMKFHRAASLVDFVFKVSLVHLLHSENRRSIHHRPRTRSFTTGRPGDGPSGDCTTRLALTCTPKPFNSPPGEVSPAVHTKNCN